jgi:hypothetical protein
VGDVVHHVLEDLGLVGAANQGVEQGADFALAGSGDFVVMNFNLGSRRLPAPEHGGTDVVQAVDRRNGEVAALDGRAVAGAAAIRFFRRRSRLLLKE